MSAVNDDIREILAKHLLTDRDKAYISAWLHSGMDNQGIAARLYDILDGRSDTVILETGDTADYYASGDGLAVDIQAALTPEEYKSARVSTLNAHYTSPTVIKAIYGNMFHRGRQAPPIKIYITGLISYKGMGYAIRTSAKDGCCMEYP